jgi:hypothetical protein
MQRLVFHVTPPKIEKLGKHKKSPKRQSNLWRKKKQEGFDFFTLNKKIGALHVFLEWKDSVTGVFITKRERHTSFFWIRRNQRLFLLQYSSERGNRKSQTQDWLCDGMGKKEKRGEKKIFIDPFDPFFLFFLVHFPWFFFHIFFPSVTGGRESKKKGRSFCSFSS